MFWQRHQKKNQCFDCLLNSFAIHGSRSVKQKDVLSFIIWVFGFFWCRSMECDSCTLLTCRTENIVWLLMTVSEFKVNLCHFCPIQLKFHIVHWYDVGYQLMTVTFVRTDLFSAVEMNTEVPFCLCVQVCFFRFRLVWQQLFKAIVKQFHLGFVSRTNVRWDSQCESIFKFALQLTDHVELNLNSFFWINVSDSDIHGWDILFLLYGHHHSIALVFGFNVLCFHNLSQFDGTLYNSIFVSDFKLC